MSSVNIRVFFLRHLLLSHCRGVRGRAGCGYLAPNTPRSHVPAPPDPPKGQGCLAMGNWAWRETNRTVQLSWLPKGCVPRRGFWMLAYFFSCPSQQNKTELHISVNLGPTKNNKTETRTQTGKQPSNPLSADMTRGSDKA